MKINTQIELKNLAGETLTDNKEPATLGKCVSNMILQSEIGGKMKLFLLAQKFFKDKIVELDVADFNMVKETVQNTKIYNALVAGQVELLLENIKDESIQNPTKGDKAGR